MKVALQTRGCQLSRQHKDPLKHHSAHVTSIKKHFYNVLHCTKMWTFQLRVSPCLWIMESQTWSWRSFLLSATRWHNGTLNTHCSTHQKHPVSSEWINDEDKTLASVFLPPKKIWDECHVIMKTEVIAVMQFVWALWSDRVGVMHDVKRHDKLNMALKGVSAASQTAMALWIRRWRCYTLVN